MRIELRFTGCTTEQLREIAATLSQSREDISGETWIGSTAPKWAPVVQCEGPDLFGVTTPPVPLEVAARITTVL